MKDDNNGDLKALENKVTQGETDQSQEREFRGMRFIYMLLRQIARPHG